MDQSDVSGRYADIDDQDLSRMSDPDFLAERRRVRESLELLQERYEAINDEFDRRARAEWTRGSVRVKREGNGPR